MPFAKFFLKFSVIFENFLGTRFPSSHTFSSPALGCPKSPLFLNFNGLTPYSHLFGECKVPCKISAHSEKIQRFLWTSDFLKMGQKRKILSSQIWVHGCQSTCFQGNQMIGEGIFAFRCLWLVKSPKTCQFSSCFKKWLQNMVLWRFLKLQATKCKNSFTNHLVTLSSC